MFFLERALYEGLFHIPFLRPSLADIPSSLVSILAWCTVHMCRPLRVTVHVQAVHGHSMLG